MFRRVLVLVLVVTTPAYAEDAQEPDEAISIAELVTIAVRRSPELAIVRSDEKRAQLGATIADAPAEWRFNASVSGESRRDARVLAGRVGVAKQLPTGGDIAVSVESIQEQAGEVRAELTSVALDLRQPLLRGIGQASRVDTKKAAIAADAATLTARDANAATIRDLIEAYWELAFARASLAVRKQSLALAQSQLELSKKMHDRGTVPDSAVVAAKYGVALRQEAKLRAGDAVQSASLRLRRVAGLEIGIELGDLAPTDTLVVPKDAPDVEAAIATALAKSPRIAAAKLGISIADVEVAYRKNLAMPSLDVAVSGGVAGERQALSTRDYQILGRLELRWELGGAARAAADAAKLDRSAAKLSAKDVERETIALVIDVARRLRAARQRADVAQSAIDLAKANLDTELALFRADKSSNVLVFERQTELDEARLLASRAAADCQIALATLDYLTGALLERHGVEATNRR
jgi:outer membrane protein TolC